MSVPDALNLAIQIVSSLAAAHTARIVHRDIKPANIMVTRTGLVKVLDFGLARIQARHTEPATDTLTMGPGSYTDPKNLAGTLAYMSPEQLQGLPLDQRSDIFSVGLVLFQMLTGRHAFQGGSQIGLIYEIVHKPARP